MAWQLLVIVAQLGIGAGLVLGGLRRAAHYWLAWHNKDHAERLAKRTGQAACHSLKPAFIGPAMMAVGVVMVATIDIWWPRRCGRRSRIKGLPAPKILRLLR